MRLLIYGLNFAPEPTGAGKFTGEMANVGAGSIDWKPLFAAAQTSGVKHFIVEHDAPKSPLEDMAASFNYVRDLRF